MDQEKAGLYLGLTILAVHLHPEMFFCGHIYSLVGL
jgi:hypothetical protein